MLYQIAASVPGMKIHPLFAERGSAFVKKDAAQIAADAQANNVTGTPTIFVGTAGAQTTQVPMQNGLDETTLVKYLDAAVSG